MIRLIEFCTVQNLIIENTFYQHKRIWNEEENEESKRQIEKGNKNNTEIIKLKEPKHSFVHNPMINCSNSEPQLIDWLCRMT